MIGTVSDGMIRRAAFAVSKDLRQRQRIEDDECYSFRVAALEWARGEY